MCNTDFYIFLNTYFNIRAFVGGSSELPCNELSRICGGEEDTSKNKISQSLEII